jgi:hypothetical protein
MTDSERYAKAKAVWFRANTDMDKADADWLRALAHKRWANAEIAAIDATMPTLDETVLP